MNGVSIIVPAYNAGGTLDECLRALTSLERDGELEIILVNDGSTDRTREIAESFSAVNTINVSHYGAARATNLGIKAARHDIIALVESDVVLESDWLKRIVPRLNDPSVAGAGGCVVAANKTGLGKIAGYDVELRLGRAPVDIDHLSNTNSVYRRGLLNEVGLLNEELTAGYDADLSRKLKAAGYRLLLSKDVVCRHYWKDSLKDFLRQQYNYAYYRMSLLGKPGKVHDQITGPGMILQVPFTALVLLFAIAGTLAFRWAPLALLLIPLIQLPETFSLLYRRKDKQLLLLPLLFTMRNVCWVWASLVWEIRYIAGQRVTVEAGSLPDLTDSPAR